MTSKSDRTMEWITESDYCDRVANGEETLKNFNYDRKCFQRYVRMQAENAAREGYTQIADHLYALTASYVFSDSPK
jgi:hypothetical protein